MHRHIHIYADSTARQHSWTAQLDSTAAHRQHICAVYTYLHMYTYIYTCPAIHIYTVYPRPQQHIHSTYVLSMCCDSDRRNPPPHCGLRLVWFCLHKENPPEKQHPRCLILEAHPHIRGGLFAVWLCSLGVQSTYMGISPYMGMGISPYIGVWLCSLGVQSTYI